MTRSTLALAAALLAATSAVAAPLSPAEALQRALTECETTAPSFTGMKTAGKITPAMTISTSQGTPSIYVINNLSTEGYMVVAADDVALPLLGWADEGSFDEATMAPGLRYWLGQLAEQIEVAVAQGEQSAAGAPTYYPAIAPKMTTKWDQDYPYNLMCPLVGSQRTYTGCVATAMAQVLKARNYPTKGVGTYSYDWSGQTLSFDYGNTTFKWDQMLNSYGSTATAAQRDAVAELMYACGVGVDMGYGIYSSGAVSAKVARCLIDNFGYDKGMEFCCRAFYTAEQWEKMIYDELAANGPVYMSGRNDEGGHAFVADGYNKGFLHMNWGWSGLSDGYYRVNALDPDSQGTGGSSAGYNVDQGMLRGVKPAEAGSEYAAPYLMANRPISAYFSGNQLYITGPFYSYSTREVSGRVGVQLYDATTGEEGQLLRMSIRRFAPGTGITTMNLSCSLLREGHWKGVLVFTEGANADMKVTPIHVPLSQAGYLDIVKEGTNYSVTVPSNGTFTPGELEFVSPMYTNKTFSVKLKYTSTAEDNYTHEVVGYLLDPTTLEVVAQAGVQNSIIEPGSHELVYTSDWLTTPAVGSYKFALAAADSPGTEIDFLSAKYDVDLTRGSATYVASVSEWSIDNASAVDINNITFNVTVNITYGYMASALVARIYDETGTGNPIGTISSPLVFGTKGDEVKTTFSGPFLEGTPNTSYKVYIYDARGNRLSTQAKSITTSTSGIADIPGADDLDGAVYYNLQGQAVATPVSGELYIVRTLSGKTFKMVK